MFNVFRGGNGPFAYVRKKSRVALVLAYAYENEQQYNFCFCKHTLML